MNRPNQSPHLQSHPTIFMDHDLATKPERRMSGLTITAIVVGFALFFALGYVTCATSDSATVEHARDLMAAIGADEPAPLPTP